MNSLEKALAIPFCVCLNSSNIGSLTRRCYYNNVLDMIFHKLIAPLEETEKKKKKRLGNMLKLGSHFQSNNFILPMNENFINTLQIELRISLTLFYNKAWTIYFFTSRNPSKFSWEIVIKAIFSDNGILRNCTKRLGTNRRLTDSTPDLCTRPISFLPRTLSTSNCTHWAQSFAFRDENG